MCSVSFRRGADRGHQAGEGGEEAAGVDQAGAAEEGQRSAVSEPTPQEPRPVENAEFSRILLSHCRINLYEQMIPKCIHST